ncbi:MAG: hypothetical protein ABL898_07600 [Hyphomicrobiaceae bacterium]|nr:hypothetical protein [Hyphomicrobiaceae bacterium]
METETKEERCRLVMVTWEDSRQPTSKWTFLSDLPDHTAVKCTTVGWLLKDNDDVKVLAQSMGDIDADEMQTSGVMTIPARCVIAIKNLEEEATSASSAYCRDVA